MYFTQQGFSFFTLVFSHAEVKGNSHIGRYTYFTYPGLFIE